MSHLRPLGEGEGEEHVKWSALCVLRRAEPSRRGTVRRWGGGRWAEGATTHMPAGRIWVPNSSRASGDWATEGMLARRKEVLEVAESGRVWWVVGGKKKRLAGCPDTRGAAAGGVGNRACRRLGQSISNRMALNHTKCIDSCDQATSASAGSRSSDGPSRPSDAGARREPTTTMQAACASTLRGGRALIEGVCRCKHSASRFALTTTKQQQRAPAWSPRRCTSAHWRRRTPARHSRREEQAAQRRRHLMSQRSRGRR